MTKACAVIFHTPAPLTRDLTRIGMASCFSDTRRMKQELPRHMSYPSLDQGIDLLPSPEVGVSKMDADAGHRGRRAL
jgi:hypothetical protein